MIFKIIPAVVAVAVIAVLVFLAGCSWKRPSNLGVVEGKLRECPSTPNCVSSQSARENSRVEAIVFQGTPEEARKNLLAVLEGMPRTKIIKNDGNYLHAEFTTALFRFVDDVEFLFDNTAGVINVRSASRVGRSDFGANRKRVEDIRVRFSGK